MCLFIQLEHNEHETAQLIFSFQRNQFNVFKVLQANEEQRKKIKMAVDNEYTAELMESIAESDYMRDVVLVAGKDDQR